MDEITDEVHTALSSSDGIDRTQFERGLVEGQQVYFGGHLNPELMSWFDRPWPSESTRLDWIEDCRRASCPAGAVEIGLDAWLEAACKKISDSIQAMTL